MTETSELIEGLRDTARWIRAKDPLASNFLYCLRAADRLEELSQRPGNWLEAADRDELLRCNGELALLWRKEAERADAAEAVLQSSTSGPATAVSERRLQPADIPNDPGGHGAAANASGGSDTTGDE